MHRTVARGGVGGGQGSQLTQFNSKLNDETINDKSEAFSTAVQEISRCQQVELAMNMVVKVIIDFAC